MRRPLALKVTAWLLLNFLVVLVLIAGLLALSGGLTWRALVEGPPGRRITTLAESTFAAMADLNREERQSALEEFGTTNGVGIAWLSGGGGPGGNRIIAGTLNEIPAALREALRPQRPRPHPTDEFGGERESPPPRRRDELADNREPPAPRRQPVLLHEGQPRAFWLGVPVGKAGQPPVIIILRVPSFTTLFRLLDLVS